MVVFDRDGNFLRSWGEGVFRRAHGVHMAPDDTLWLTDDGDHTVRHCTLEGKVLLTIGVPGEPFHRCTHAALSPQGDLYVADRENHRVQVFDGHGKYEAQWNNMHRPSGLFLAHGPHPRFYAGEIGGGMAVNYDMPNIGPRVSIYSPRASCWRAWATARPGSSRASSSPRTGSPWIPAATSTSAKCPSPESHR